MVAALLLFAGASLAGPAPAAACTTILIGRSLTADGSVIHAHNEDMGNDAVGRLWWAPPATHAAGATLRVPYVELPQAPATFGYWASGNAQGAAGLGTSGEARPYDSVLVGLNDRGVAMSCNWAHSREENREGTGIRRYAIRQLLLERATSARHGVELLGQLIETYGQADWGGLIYHLADSREAWVVETTTRNWVARRVRDDEMRVTANRFRIGADYDLASPTLVADAVANGWLGPADEPLDFSRVYGQPGKMDQPYDSRREERVVELLAAKSGAITPDDLLPVLRDRYEGSGFYTPPQELPVWREDLDRRPEISRTIGTNLAQSTFVAHLRAGLPVSAGAVMWLGLGTPGYAGYVPLYAGGGSLPPEFSRLEAEESDDSAWWLFRRLQRAADRDYETRYPPIRAAWDELHSATADGAREVERRALALVELGEGREAARLLAAYTLDRGERVLELVRRIYRVSPLAGRG